MKRALLVLAATLAPVLGAAPAHAACSAAVRYAGATYLGSAISVADGRALTGAVIPGCNDVVTHDAQGNDTSPREPDEPIDAHRIARVPARLGLAYNGRAYLAIGYLPQLAGHPLHRAWSRRREAMPSCGRAWHLRATVAITPTPGPVPVRTGRGHIELLDFEAHARVHGLDRDGYPYLSQGRRLRALVRSCSTPLGGRVLLASRVAAVA
ncbi:MAG TPA: hypothetical protein VGJ70_07405 [Solirubrobacteraceae bacterium]